MRIQDLTKEELKSHIVTSGQWLRMGATPLWKEAFLRYNKETKNKLKPSCAKCFEVVKRWLD